MVYIALFALGAALVTLFFYLILNPRVLTTEGETFDLRFVLFMLLLILLLMKSRWVSASHKA